MTHTKTTGAYQIPRYILIVSVLLLLVFPSAAQNNNAAFSRFAKSFKISGPIPPVSLEHPESIQAFQDHISKAYGNRGKFMVQNQEFPQGSGRMRSSISDFVF